jgi:hypothetical protein
MCGRLEKAIRGNAAGIGEAMMAGPDVEDDL